MALGGREASDPHRSTCHASEHCAAMCGRFLNKPPAAEIARIFRSSNPLPNYPARYNIAPTDQVLTVRFNAKPQERTPNA
jgi:hypothetical protein